MKKRLWLAGSGLVAFGITRVLISHKRSQSTQNITLGASFSAQYCRDLGLDSKNTLKILLSEVGVRRFRLMSHWNLLEYTRGQYDFRELDWQMDTVAQAGGTVSLTLGLRQPHYPECHMPEWARGLSKPERNKLLFQFIQAVVERYRRHPALESWQLENEAYLKHFGECADYDRTRIATEINMVAQLDPYHPLIMTMSDSFGLPIRGPRPDIYGFSLYRRMHHGHHYVDSPIPAWWYRLRAALIEHYFKRPVIIHELQTEPWGPGGTQHLSRPEQDKSMTADRLRDHVAFAAASGIRHIDLWGGEWWVWRRERYDDATLLVEAKRLFNNPSLAKERI